MHTAQLFGGLLLAMTLAVPAGAADKVIKMSTTTSTQDSGLLDVLLPALEKDTGIQVKVIAKGTGAAIRDGVDGNVDAIFVHDTAREEKFVADGFGTKRYGVMHNDFIVIGPAADPAKVKGAAEGGEFIEQIEDRHSRLGGIAGHVGKALRDEQAQPARIGGQAIGRQDEEHRDVAALEIGKAEIGAAEDGDHAGAVEEMGMALRGREDAGRFPVGFAEVAICGAGDQAAGGG